MTEQPIEQSSVSVKYKLWGWRAGQIVFETLAVLAVLAVAITGVAAWRLSSGPLDVGFAREYIETALHNPDRGTHATMDGVFLQWPDLKGPLQLSMHNVKILDRKDKTIVGVNEAVISLSRAKLLIGRIAPVSLILKKPALRVIRRVNGSFDVGFGNQANVASEEVVEQADEQTSLVERILEYIARPGNQAAEKTPLATLKSFEIERARVMVEDHVIGVTWFLPRLDVAFHSTEEGLEADLYAELPGGREEVAHAKTRLLFDWDSKDVALTADLKNFDARVLAGKIPALADLYDQDLVFDARLEALLDSNFRPREARISVVSEKGSFLIPEFSAEPVPFEKFGLQASYDSITKELDVPEVMITVKNVALRGDAAFIQDGNKRASGWIKIAIDEVEQKDIGPLWPESLRGDVSEDWIVKKLSGGVFHDAFAQIDLVLEKTEEGWNFETPDINAGFLFTDMTVDYRSPMIPVTQAKGQGSFNYKTEMLKIDIESAMISDLTVEEAHLEFVDIIKVGAGVADINVKLQGPLKTGLEYVSKEPISLEHKFDLAKVQGKVDALVNVNFPTKKDIKIAEVKVGVEGTLSDVSLPNVVKTLELTGGPLNIAVKSDQFQVKGSGKLSGRPVNLTYKEFLSSKGKAYKNQVTADLLVDSELRTYFGINLSDFIEGTVPVNLVYTEYEGGRSEADVKADLTPVKAFVESFDYEKPVGVAGTADLKAVFQNENLNAVTGLTATAPQLSLESSTLAFVQRGAETVLTQGKLSRFVIEETVGKLQFDIEPSGLMKVVLEAPFLDLRPFLDKEEGEKLYDEPPMQISLAADRMRTAEGQTVQYGKIFVDIDKEGRFNQLELDAIAGSGDVYLRFKPDASGKRVFRFEADDAGATLRAFGIYDKIQGGTMTAYAEPIKGVYDRNLVGLAEITNFKVVKAPVLAKLLGALSLPGLMNLLGDEGVGFTKLEAKFDWLYRPDGSILVLKDGRTAGNSLGLTFDGTYDKAAGKVDMSGTMVPLSGVNQIIGNIPLIGDILTGGSGGIFAATYTVKGPAENPEIFVNPLSVLAPGILRRILFENN